MRVLFVYPNHKGINMLPTGVALLSACLKRENHIVELFDTTYYDSVEIEGNKDSSDSDKSKSDRLMAKPYSNPKEITLKYSNVFEDFKNTVDTYSPDLLALSTTEDMFHLGLSLLKSLKGKRPLTIAGGVFPTFAPELVMQYPNVDMLCVGEGENTIIDLANTISNKDDYSNITNLWIKQNNGTIIKNSVSRPVDINEVPAITDIELFDEQRFYRPMGGKIRRLLPVETHRGCPYTCSFCNSPGQNRLYGDGDFLKGMSFFRKKSMDLVKEEIQNHIKKHNVEYIYFWADTFLAWSDQEFQEFVKMYSKIKLPFWCQTRIETIDEEKFRMLKDVGLDRVTFGLEHGNEDFRRDVVKREYSNEDAVKKIKIVEKLGITFSVNNIIGFPDETRKLAFDTIELNRQFNSDNTSCSILVPFHGTEIHDLCVKKGYLDPNVICAVSTSGESLIDMPKWDKKDMIRLRDVFAMYIKFPKSRWTEVREAETNMELRGWLREEFVKTYWSDSKAKIEDDIAEAAKGLF